MHQNISKAARPRDHPIDHRTVDVEARARQITGGPAVELILDAIGMDSPKKGYRLLAPTGRLGIFGVSSGPPTRPEGCSACCACSRARPGFSSIPVPNERQ